MTHDLPLWAEIVVSALLIVGATCSLLGAIGTLQLRTFFDRMHAPTLGASAGTAAILSGSIIYFSVTGSRLAVHEIAIGVFLMITAPVTLILLGRASLYRERNEKNDAVPPISIVAGEVSRIEPDLS